MKKFEGKKDPQIHFKKRKTKESKYHFLDTKALVNTVIYSYFRPISMPQKFIPNTSWKKKEDRSGKTNSAFSPPSITDWQNQHAADGSTQQPCRRASATGGKQPPASSLQRWDSPPCWLNWNQCLPNGFDVPLKKGNFQPLKLEIPVTIVRAGKVCKAEWSPKQYFHFRRF